MYMDIILDKERKMESEIYPVTEYILQTANYISKLKNIPIEQATKYVKTQIQLKNNIPKVKYYQKNQHGDKVIRTANITTYIKDSLKDNDVIVPSFTTYVNTDKLKSIHSEFMATNTKKRSAYKKAAFKAKQDGDMDSYNVNNCMQKATKILNNSLSGVYGSKSTILYNPSAHYTLTSITRCVASIGNAVTESFIYGNKHFKDYNTIHSYIATILSNYNRDNVELCIRKFKLHIPTAEEVYTVINSSSRWYVNDVEQEERLKTFINCLTETDRVAIVYTNDLWHLKEYNPKLVRLILTRLTDVIEDPSYDSNCMSSIAEVYQILTKVILHNEVKGKNIDYKELENSPLGYKLFGTANNIVKLMSRLDILFKTFFTTNILPPTIAYIKEMFRDGIVLSDTDSTCCAYDRWVEWYNDDSRSIAVAGALVMLLSKCIDSALYNLSRNMNINPNVRNVLAMKNEFFWPVFISSNTNKHYFATVTIQEGNVFKEPELEVKGVHFIASNANQTMVKQVKQIMRDVLDQLSRNEDISVVDYMLRVKDLEQQIVNMVNTGNVEIFKKNNIKDKASYIGEPNLTPYLHYLMWEEVFSKYYGRCDTPPYMAIKIPTTLDKEKVLQSWLDNMENRDLAKDLQKFFKKNGKTSFKTFMLPLLTVGSNGLPKELIPSINIRRIIQDNLKSAYLVLECLGVYLKPDQLVSDII